MAQHDYVIANGTGASVRSDINDALAAIVSQNSGATAPATTFAYQLWADTTTGTLKLRNAANNAWIQLMQLDGEWSSLALENGTPAAPSIYFKDSGTDTGFYSPGANQVGIATDGAARLTFGATGDATFTGALRLSGSTSGYVGLAPAAAAGSVTYTLPSADGTSGQVLSTNGSAVLSWVSGSATANYQEFTSNGTWTKPAGCSTVYVELVGGGAGGGSGTRQATTVQRIGGGGGAGGSGVYRFFKASDLTATVSVTVGAGGAGGAAVTTDTTNGNAGIAGGNTQFGSYLTSEVAGSGTGGSTTSGTGGSRSTRGLSGVNCGSGGASSNATAVGGGTAVHIGGGGGGGGGGRGANNTSANTGGGGGVCCALTSSGPAAAGANATTNEGGGGGGGSYTTAVAGTNGGNGAFPGGGGGGGSASDNGFASGAGGNGAAGVVRVWSW